MSSKKLVSERLDNKVLANKDEINKDEAESHIIVGPMILALQLPFFLAGVSLNVMFIDVY